MARLICRWPNGAAPTAKQASAAGIGAWLVAMHTLETTHGQGDLVVAAEQEALQLCGLPFALEWHLDQPPNPRRLERVAEQLQDWLAHPRYLRWQGKTPLWIADPDQLSCSAEIPALLQQLLGSGILLWGRGQLDWGLDGNYGSPLQDWPCQELDSGQLNYQSFLYHAYRWPATAAATQIPAVLACSAAEERRFANASSVLYQEWLTVSCRRADLCHSSGEQPWALVENWAGHHRWWQSTPPPVGKCVDKITPAPHGLPTPICIHWGVMRATHPALLVHADQGLQLESLLGIVADGEQPTLDIYVSTLIGEGKAIAQRLQQLGWQQGVVVEVAHADSDLGPFVEALLPRAIASGHSWVVRLNASQSHIPKEHIPQTEQLWQAIASQEALDTITEAFRRQPNLGLVAAPGALIPASTCLHNTGSEILPCLRRYGLSMHTWFKQPIVAGGMFAARVQALQLLLRLKPSRNCKLCLEHLVAALVMRSGYRIHALASSSLSQPPWSYGRAAPRACERLKRGLIGHCSMPKSWAPAEAKAAVSTELDWCVLVGHPSPWLLELALSTSRPVLVVCANASENHLLRQLQTQMHPYQLQVREALVGAKKAELRWYNYNDSRHNSTLTPHHLQQLYPNLQLESSEPIQQLPLSTLLEEWTWATGHRGWLLAEGHANPEELLLGAGPWLHYFAEVWLTGLAEIETNPEASWQRLLNQALLLPLGDGRWLRNEKAWLRRQIRELSTSNSNLTYQIDQLQADLNDIENQLETLLQLIDNRIH